MVGWVSEWVDAWKEGKGEKQGWTDEWINGGRERGQGEERKVKGGWGKEWVEAGGRNEWRLGWRVVETEEIKGGKEGKIRSIQQRLNILPLILGKTNE